MGGGVDAGNDSGGVTGFGCGTSGRGIFGGCDRGVIGGGNDGGSVTGFGGGTNG